MTGPRSEVGGARGTRPTPPKTAAGSTAGRPNFLIIGAMKAGTTSLARYLMEHPQVFMARCKEVHYFDRQYERGPAWYAEHFRDAGPLRAVGEATPNYLYSKTAIERIGLDLPDARLIAILRNPVDRAYSHYWHEQARGRETRSFMEAIEAELRSSPKGPPSRFSYLDQGRYVDQLQYVEAFFPRDRTLVILLEDLQRQPLKTFQRICHYVDADSRLVPRNLGRRYNEYVAFRSAALRSLARGLSAGPAGVRFFGRAIGRLNTRRIAYPAMDDALRARLVELFRDPNEALASRLGRDLSSWNR